MLETWVQSLGWEAATHSSTLAWKIPWMEEPRRLQSMESQRVGHNGATSLSLFSVSLGIEDALFVSLIAENLFSSSSDCSHR